MIKPGRNKRKSLAPQSNTPPVTERLYQSPPPKCKQAEPDPLTPTQSEFSTKIHGLMFPCNDVLKHPAAKMLLKWATDGCPVDCGEPWSIERIQAAIDKAAHPSAQSNAAATACRNKALERVKDGCAKLIKWDDIKHNPPINLKVSPLAAIPHKSRDFRMILDLSYNIKVNGIKLQSVNEM